MFRATDSGVETVAPRHWLLITIDEIDGHNFPGHRWYEILDRRPSTYCIKLYSRSSTGYPQVSAVKENESNPKWEFPFNCKVRFDPEGTTPYEIDVELVVNEQSLGTETIELAEAGKINTDSSTVSHTFKKDHKIYPIDITYSWEYVCDPYKEFKIESRPCYVLSIDKIEGINLSKGLPNIEGKNIYIKLSCNTKPISYNETSKEVQINSNTEDSPVWENPFPNVKFAFDPDKENKLHFSINSINKLPEIDLKDLISQKQIKLRFEQTPETGLDVYFLLQLDSVTDVRLESELCNEEQTFVQNRKEHVRKALGLSTENDKIPTIAVIGSGGGFRALIGYHGAMCGLQKSGILDIVTYCAGLSGSAWYLSTLYSSLSQPKRPSIEETGDLMRKSVCTRSWKKNEKVAMITLLLKFWEEKSHHGVTTFTDVFGRYIGEILLGERLDSTLTHMAEGIKDRDPKYPMPICSAIHVKNDESAQSFHEWVEFSPYEIAIPKYKISVKPENFKSTFTMGRVVTKVLQQPPLYYFQGIWGSAYCIQLWSFLKSFLFGSDIPTPEMLRRAEREKIAHAKKVLEGEKTASPGEDENKDGWLTKFRKAALSALRFIPDHIRIPILDTISLRSGSSQNFMKDTTITESKSQDDFQPKTMLVPIGFKHIFDKSSTTEDVMYMVDAGIAINSPYPPVLRRERKIDVILSFDFSARKSDNFENCFQELILAESWANVSHLPFPNIETKLPDIKEKKECYIFENEDDPDCPIVMHFPLINTKFTVKDLIGQKAKDTSSDELFKIFDDPEKTYSTFKFNFTEDAFDELSKLMELNVTSCKSEIIDTIKKVVNREKGPKP